MCSRRYITRGVNILYISLLVLTTFAVRAEGGNITLWHKETDAKEFLQNSCEEFSRDNHITVTSEYIPVNQLKQTLIKADLFNILPDVVLVPSDFIGIHSQIHLSEIPTSLNNPNISEKSYSTVILDRKIYGAPILGGNHIMMYYNKKKVKKPAATWEELLEQKPALEQLGIKPIGWSYSDAYWFVGFIGAFGGWPMDGEKITLDTKAVQQALLFYKSLADKGLIPQDCGYQCNTRRFFNGEFAYALNGDWAYLQTEKALGDDFGVAVIPFVGTHPVTPMYSTHALVFPGDSLQGNKKESLVKFLLFMQSESVQRRWRTELKRLPVHEKILDEFREQADLNQQQLLKQLTLAKPMPNSPAMSFAWEGIRKGFYLFLTGSIDAQKAAKLMQETAEPQKTQ